jgi:hypothetical protein
MRASVADLIHPPARFVPLRSRRRSGRLGRPVILTSADLWQPVR